MTQPNPAQASPQTPDNVARLQAIYGLPSQAGFGSAVFHQQVEPPNNLEQVALRVYRHFVGDLWEQFGEAAWTAPWTMIYQRQPGSNHQIVSEMRSIADVDAVSLVPLLLDEIEDADIARTVLAAVYDSADLVGLTIYKIGDSAAMSGLLIAGEHKTNEATLLIFLLD